MHPEASELTRLEKTLWSPETRFDRDFMNDVLAQDFHEFGQSGRRYERLDVLPTADQRDTLLAELHNLKCRSISEDVSLVTYVCELNQGSETLWSNRSSVWHRVSGQWKLCFHQGTPTEAI